MEYFYNTLGVLGAGLLIILAFDLWRIIIKLVGTYLERTDKEAKEALAWIRKLKDISWYVYNTSQPPNEKMITLHLRSRGSGEYLETNVSIDKDKY